MKKCFAFLTAVLFMLFSLMLPAEKIFAEEQENDAAYEAAETEGQTEETTAEETLPSEEETLTDDASGLPAEDPDDVTDEGNTSEDDAPDTDAPGEPAVIEESGEEAPEASEETVSSDEGTSTPAEEAAPENTEDADEAVSDDSASDEIIIIEEEELSPDAPADLQDDVTEVKEERMASAEEEEDEIDIFVRRCYTVILGRNASKAEIQRKGDSIRSGSNTGASTLRGFFHSNEFAKLNVSDTEYIKRLYKAAFNREADDFGVSNRLKELEYGFTWDYILKKVTGSAEFKSKCAAAGIEQGSITLTDVLDKNPKAAIYVYDLYKTIMGRKPDRKGQETKTKAVVSGGARSVIPGFFRSSEYVNKKRTDEEFINDVYLACLKRPADATGLKNRKSDIDNGMSRMYVLKYVLNSSSFESKAKAAGVKAGTFPEGVLEFSDGYKELTQYVVKTYRGGLNRKPIASEINTKVRYLLDQDLYVTDYLHNIAFSSEFSRKHTTDDDVVKGLYQLLLFRTPSSSEIASSKERLTENGKEDLFKHILYSSECSGKLDAYGLTTEDGFSRRFLIRYLAGMENSDYYLGTPYTGTWGPNSSLSTVPNGERWSNGYAALNCSGFVASVLKNCGANLNRVIGVTGIPIANAYSWVRYCRAVCPSAVSSYVDKSTMLAADRADNTVIEKCDLLFMDPKVWGDGADCHVGIYYGSSPGEDRFWHQPHSGNCISPIRLPWPDCTMYVIKTDILSQYLR